MSCRSNSALFDDQIIREYLVKCTNYEFNGEIFFSETFSDPEGPA
jgi:hypothetical protein